MSADSTAAKTGQGNDPNEEVLPPDIAKKARALLWSLVRPRLGAVLTLCGLVILTSVAGVLGPVYIASALDDGLPAAVAGNTTPLTLAVGAFVVTALVGGAGSWTMTRLMGVTAQRLLVDLRGRLFRHVQRLDLAYHERSTSGRLVARQTSDMESVQAFFNYGLIEASMSLLSMAAIAVILVVLDIPLALVTFAGFIPLAFLTVWAQRTQRAAFRRTRTAIAKTIVHFTETMGGIRAVQAFRRQPHGRRRLAASDDDFANANAEALRGVAWFAGGTRLIGGLSQVAVIIVGAALVIGGHTQIGVMAAFVLYLRRFYGPLDELVQILNMYQSAAAALEKIAAVLDAQPAIEDPASPRALPSRAETAGAVAEAHSGERAGSDEPASGGSTPAAAGREMVFDGVEFSYDGEHAVIPRLDLTIAAGSTIALVGTTGAGKTTLVKLLTRFYDPTAGRVLLDGVDLRDLDDARLRESVVMVTQESFLFGGTIADNIRIGRPDAADAQVEAAAKAVGLDEFVRRLPDGYATDVKKRGGRLSSGQRQLVSFARVFLADPDVLILDEATAHLDIPSERLVQAALATVLEGRTAVIIAHRLSTVEIADRVLVLEHGRPVEDGTPAELIAAGGRFAQLHEAWEDSLA